MTISNAGRPPAFFLMPSDTDTTIMMLHAEPGLVWKDDMVSLLYKVYRWEQNYHRSYLWCGVKGSLNKGSRADCPCCCWRCRIVVVTDICRSANKTISWIEVHNVAIRSYKADLTTCLSFRALVARGRWNLAWRSVWPFWTHSCPHDSLRIPTNTSSSIAVR